MFREGSLDKERRTRYSSYEIENIFPTQRMGLATVETWTLSREVLSPSEELLSWLLATWYLSTSKEQMSYEFF